MKLVGQPARERTTYGVERAQIIPRRRLWRADNRKTLIADALLEGGSFFGLPD